MKLKCPKGCKVKSKKKFYRTWSCLCLYNEKCEEIDISDSSWDTRDSFHCVKCHETAVEVK